MLISEHEHPYNDYVSRSREFAPLAEKVENLLIHQAIFERCIMDMVANTDDIKKSMHQLVIHDALRTWALKVGIWFGGIISTLVTCHFIGFLKIITKFFH